MFGGNPPPASGFGQSGLQPSKNPYAISAASKSFSGTLATQTTNFGGPSPWNQKAGGHTAGLTPPTTTFGSGFATGFGGSGASPAPTPFAGSTGIKAADKPTESLPYQASIFGNDAKTNANSNTGHLFGSSSFAGSQPRAFGGQSFKCRVCQSAFQSSDELRKHIKSENHFDPSRPANQGSAQPSGFGPQAGSKPTFGSQSDVAYNPTAGNKLQGFAEPSAARDEKPPYPPSTYTGVAPVQQGQGLGQGHGQMQSMNQDQNQHGFAPRAPRGAPTGNYQSNYASSGVPIINGPGGARAPWHRSGAAPSQDARQQHSQHPATAAGGGARQPPRGSLNAHPAVAGNALTGTGVSYGEAGRATSGQPPRTAAPYNTPFTPQRSAHNLAAPSAPGGPRTSSAGGANSAAHAGMGGVGGFRPTSHGTAPLSHSAHLLSSARGPPKAATTSQPVHSIQEKEEDDNPDSDDANLGVTHGGRRDNGDHASDADYVPDSADEDDSGDEEDDLNFSFSSQESGGGGGGSNGTVTRSGGSGSNSGGSSSSSSSSCAAGIAGATSGHAGAGVPPFRAAAGGGAPPQQTHQQQQQKPSLGAGVARAPGKNVSSNQLSSGDSASENESMASSADSSDAMGTCEDMCPAQERQKRLNESDVHKLELPHPEMTPGRTDYADTMVKKFQRSSADHALQIPHLLRTPEALLRTIEYIESELMDRAALGVHDPRLGEAPSTLVIYLYVWDRYRMVAKDFTLQQSVLPLSRVWVECHERMARWFILMDHRMQAAGDFISAGHGQQNGESLNNLLKTLHGHYFRSRSVPSAAAAASNGGVAVADFEMPNKAEFVCYFVIFQLGNGGEVSKYLQQLPEEILNSVPVRFAIEVWGALKTQNYAKYFRLLKTRATLLQACLMHRYVGEVRLAAMKKLARSLNPPGNNPQEYSLKDLTNMFMFESIPEAVEFVEHCGLTVATSSSTASSTASATGSSSSDDSADDSRVVLLCGQNIDQLLPRDKNDRPIPPATYYMGEWIDQRKSARPAGSTAPSHIKGANFSTHYTIAEVCRGCATGGSSPLIAPAPRAAGTLGANNTNTNTSIGVRAPITVGASFGMSAGLSPPPASVAVATKPFTFGGLGAPTDATSGSSNTTTAGTAANTTTIDKAALRNKLMMSSTLSSGRGAKAAHSPIAPITDADVWGPADTAIKGSGAAGRKNSASKDPKRESPALLPPAPPAGAIAGGVGNSRVPATIPPFAAPPSNAPAEGSWRKKTVAPTLVAPAGGSEATKRDNPFAFNSNAPAFTPGNMNQINRRVDGGMGVKVESNGGGLGLELSGKGQVSRTSGALAAPAPFPAASFGNPFATDKIAPSASIPTPASTAAAAPAVSTLEEPKKLMPVGGAPSSTTTGLAASFSTNVSSFCGSGIQPSHVNPPAIVSTAANGFPPTANNARAAKEDKKEKEENAAAAMATSAAWEAASTATLGSKAIADKSAPTLPLKMAVATPAPAAAEKIPLVRPPINEAKLRAFEARMQQKRNSQVLRKTVSFWSGQAAQSAAVRLSRTKAVYLLLWRQAHKRALQQRRNLIEDIASINIVDSVMQGLGGMNLRATDEFRSSSMHNALKRKQSQQGEVERLVMAAEREQQTRLSLLCDFHSPENSNLVQQQRGVKSMLSSVGKTLQAVKTCQLRSLLGLPVATSIMRDLKADPQSADHFLSASTSAGEPQFRGDLFFKIALVSGCSTSSGVVCNPACTSSSGGGDSCSLVNALRATLANEAGYGYTTSTTAAHSTAAAATTTFDTADDIDGNRTSMSRNQLVKMRKRRGQLAKALSAHNSHPCVRVGLHSAAISASTTLHLSVVDVTATGQKSKNPAATSSAKESQLLEQIGAVSSIKGVQGVVIILESGKIRATASAVQRLFQCLQHSVPFVLIILDDERRSDGGGGVALLMKVEELDEEDDRALRFLEEVRQVVPAALQSALRDLLQGCLLVRASNNSARAGAGAGAGAEGMQTRLLLECMQRAVQLLSASAEPTPCVTRQRAADWLRQQLLSTDPSSLLTDGGASQQEQMFAAADVRTTGHTALASAINEANQRIDTAIKALQDMRSTAMKCAPHFPTADFLRKSKSQAETATLLGGLLDLSVVSTNSNDEESGGGADTILPGDWAASSVYDSLLTTADRLLRLPAWHPTVSIEAYQAQLLQYFTSILAPATSLKVHAQSFVSSLEAALNEAFATGVYVDGLCKAINDIVRDVMEERIAALESIVVSPYLYYVLEEPASLSRLLDRLNPTPQPASASAEPPFMSPVAGAKHLHFAGPGANYFEQAQYSQAFPTGFGRDSLFAQFGGPQHYSHVHNDSPVVESHRTKRTMQDTEVRNHYSSGSESKQGGYAYNVSSRLSFSTQYGGEGDGDADREPAGSWEQYGAAGDDTTSTAFKRTRYSGETAHQSYPISESDRAIQAFDRAFEASRSPSAAVRAAPTAATGTAVAVAVAVAVADPATDKLKRQLQADQQAEDRLNQLLEQALHSGHHHENQQSHQDEQQQGRQSVFAMGQDPMAFIEQCRLEREDFKFRFK